MTTSYDIKNLKAGGLMKQKQPDLFSVRLRVVGGHVDACQLECLGRLAVKYGSGHVHLTMRQGVEIPDVPFKHIEALRRELADAGLEFGACGQRVRTITACQGGSCSHGLIDPQDLARRIDAIVFGRSGLPHKFKIGVAGCPNGCIKPCENDLGIMGVVDTAFRPEACDLCGLCVHACPVEALAMTDDRIECLEARCIGCGACVSVCPRQAWTPAATLYVVFVGGKMGKVPHLARALPMRFQNDDAVLHTVTRVIDWYAAHGAERERFADTLDRLGLPALVTALG